MPFPVGDYQCKLDGKGRLMFPADFQQQLGDLLDEGFVLRPGLYHKCIEMYTLKDWQVKQEKLKQLSPFVKVNIDLMRRYNAGARMVKLDSSGRLLIPKPLLDQSELKKEVVIVALPEYMEIWDKDSYQAVNEEMDQETLEQLMQQKFGDK
ncbi:MAG: division/cell wall cluster transcriptional repressor MraZ [Bacteroidetes bacterium]|nr:division/cell wall cluster transcriptional repressor MraZ [Bacteroidota bacterium]